MQGKCYTKIYPKTQKAPENKTCTKNIHEKYNIKNNNKEKKIKKISEHYLYIIC